MKAKLQQAYPAKRKIKIPTVIATTLFTLGNFPLLSRITKKTQTNPIKTHNRVIPKKYVSKNARIK